MKKKRAFTLIEIITVIIIIGIIALVAVPAISSYLNDSRDLAYETYEKSMIDAAKNRTIKCINNEESPCEFPSVDSKVNLYLSQLVENGYIELMKDPKSKKFCDSELSYVEISGHKNDYSFQACLYCGNYQTDNPICITYENDGDLPVCGETIGEGTINSWTKEDRTISVGCSDATSGCTRNIFTKKFKSTTATSTITIADKKGNQTSCPVNVYVDKTPPTCEIVVEGNYVPLLGWYIGVPSVKMQNIIDTDSGIDTYGMGTSVSNRDYNKTTMITASPGITMVIGYVKDKAGNEGQCSKLVKVGGNFPTFDFRYEYQIYPEGEDKTFTDITENGTVLTTTSNNPTMNITHLNKYINVDQLVITLNERIQANTTASLTYIGTSNGVVDAPVKTGSKTIEFVLPRGNYQQMTIKLGELSGVSYDIDKIELLSMNGGIYTNKSVGVKVIPTDDGIQTIKYSFDDGVTFNTIDNKYFALNTSNNIKTMNAGNIVSLPTRYEITGIDNSIPSCTLRVEGLRKIGTNAFLSDATVSFESVLAPGISGVDNYGFGNASGSKTVVVSNQGANTITGYVRNEAGTIGTCSIVVEIDKNIEITYDGNGNQTNCSNGIVTYNAAYGTLCRGSSTGYAFLGWFTLPDGGVQITSTSIVESTGNHTLYAHWEKCNPGYAPTGDTITGIGTCRTCPLGYYCLNGSQVACPKGHYGIAEGQTTRDAACAKCPIGSYAQNTASTSCTPCRRENYTTDGPGATSESQCKECPSRKYIDPETKICGDCPTGYQCISGKLYVCGKGEFSLNGYCHECPSGTYQDETGQGQCKTCPDGYYNLSTHASKCRVCEIGTYTSDEVGHTRCTRCPAGYYCPGNSDKIACPLGYRTRSQGAGYVQQCESCSAGYYTPEPGAPCTTCPNGYYCPGSGQNSIKCPEDMVGTGKGKKTLEEGCKYPE